LRPLTDTMPKPMAPINGIPFLDYLIFSAIQVGIENILLLVGYKGDVIVNRYKNICNINIEFSIGTDDDQTGRRVLNSYNQLNEHFLLMYGDNYWPIEIDAMWSKYQRLDVSVSTTVFSNKDNSGEYGHENNVVVSEDGIVDKYDKKRETVEANGVDIGYFLVAKDTLDPGMSDNISFEVDILPKFIEKKRLGAYVNDNQYYYITNLKTLKNFETAARSNNFLPLPQNYFEA